MSEVGQTRSFGDVCPMSALPSKADVDPRSCDVAKVPGSDICSAANCGLFDHLVGNGEHARGNVEAKRFCGLEIDDKLEFGRLFDRQIAGIGALENSVDVACGAAKQIAVAWSITH